MFLALFTQDKDRTDQIHSKNLTSGFWVDFHLSYKYIYLLVGTEPISVSQ